MKLVESGAKGNQSYKIYRDTDWEEYRVKFYLNDVHLKKADHHTPDLDDAQGTAKAELKRGLTAETEGRE